MALSVSLKQQLPKKSELAVFFATSFVSQSKKKPEAAVKFLSNVKIANIDQTFENLGFHGELNEKCLIPGISKDNFTKALVFGLGEISELIPRKIHLLGKRVMEAVKELRVTTVDIILDQMPEELEIESFLENFVIGAHRGAYSFSRKSQEAQKKIKEIKNCSIYLESATAKLKKVVSKADIIGLGANLTSDLINMPAAEATPKKLADVALELGKPEGKKPSPLKVTVFDKKKIQQLKMGGLLGVNQGSDKPPYFIIMDYQFKKTAPTIVMVGKGITFDSGGLNVKEWMGMSSMKTDMGGAATVIGIMQAVRDLKPSVNVVGIVPTTENLSGGSAYMPGDILTMYNKKTVEVLNTDAEGRLILADGISYGAEKYNPDYLFDFATLTGACVVALGGHAAGVMTENDEYWQKLDEMSKLGADRVWRLPIWEVYGEGLKSKIADLQNVGGRWGGASSAGWFLKNFTDKPERFVHIDIAGVATVSSRASGAGEPSGFGVQMMINFFESLK